MNKTNLVNNFVIGTFVMLYLIVSVISTVHVINFFSLSNPYWLAVSLAIAFEVGAAASLASLIALDKMNKGLVWALFITITLMQMQGNMYYAFTNLQDYKSWSELFDLIEEDQLYQRRVLSFVSGAILPLVALGFIKSLVDYIKPEPTQSQPLEERVESMRKVVNAHDSLVEEIEKKTKAGSLEGPTGTNGPDDSTLQPVLAVDPTPGQASIEEPVDSTIGFDIETKDDKKDIIKTEDDLNHFLDNSGQGLVNPKPRPRIIGDDNRPTGFQHPDVIS